jgi:hypothetical protein
MGSIVAELADKIATDSGLSQIKSLEIEQNATGGVAGALKVDNDDVDKQAIVVEASNTTADVADITADAVTTAKVIDITADALTVIQNHASAVAATALTVQSDGGRGIFIDSNLAAGLPSLEIDSEHTTANTVIINGDALTTGSLMQLNADALTTGSALNIDSDSSTTGTRSLVSITNNNTAATGSTPLVVVQDSSTDAAVFQGGRVRVTKGGAPFQTALHHSWVMSG